MEHAQFRLKTKEYKATMMSAEWADAVLTQGEMHEVCSIFMTILKV